MTIPTVEFYRVDPLTGCHNFLSFVEMLDELSAREDKPPFSILYTDLNFLKQVNETRGHTHGDSVIRWLGIVLQEESQAPTYRVGGDDFAVILTNGLHATYEELSDQIFARLNREGRQLGIPAPAASMALIHYDNQRKFTFNDIMFQLAETMLDVKRNKRREIKIYRAQELIRSTARVEEQHGNTLGYSCELLRTIANDAIHRLVMMGRVLDIAQRNSFLDSISGLPNLRAAMVKLEKEIASHRPFSLLLIDGDNLRRFNSINYAAGDQLIQDMGKVISENLRPGDFIARWRTGDELIVLLPDTSNEGARVVGERFCAAIREASKHWLFPTSISIGIATFPRHGTQINALVDVAEAANKRAKEEGKDRVIVAQPEADVKEPA